MVSLTDPFKYDVFLNFRGEDTRHGFTSYLKKALDDKGVRTFMDDNELQKGEEITPSLLKAIEDSMMAIVVLSENYASSSFCLQELSKILDTMKDRVGSSVFPIFYKVDPSDVRKLKRSFGEAMEKHKANSNLDKWKVSLYQVVALSGFHYKGDMPEHKFIGEIVEQVLGNIEPIALPVGDYLVGLEHQKQHVTSLLNIGSDDTVQMVGIHGIGGIGKTTLALSVYNLIAHQFDASCFLENVRENHEKHGLPYLQKIILSKVVGEKNDLTGVRQGISILEQRLRQRKILLILDDVNELEQLKALAGKHKWFGPSSRIIITTRDKKLLTCHGVERTYEVRGLNDKDAFELVRWKAFKDEFSPRDDNVSLAQMHVLERVVAYAFGHPLALEVMGSNFSNKTIEQCKDALDRYEKVPHKKIQTTLQMCFDALEDEEKSVFLDIACCFKGWRLTRVNEILYAHHGDIMKDHINVLVEKSLIKINESGNVTLHDLVEDMGKEIVRQESPEDPGKRSRLWFSNDIMQVLEENTGTSQIEIIRFDCWTTVAWDGEAFKKMENLRTLIFTDYVFFKKHPKHLPNSLRVLECHNPSSDFLVALSLLNFPTEKFQNMRVLNLEGSSSLVQIPDVSGLPNLEKLSIKKFWKLIAIDKSVGFLGKLKILRLMDCIEIQSIPPLMLASLEELNLSRCNSLRSFPSVVDGFGDKLKTMIVVDCFGIQSFPPLKLNSLETLDLSHCGFLKSFPFVVDAFLGKLKTLNVENCQNLKSIQPLKLDSLEYLNLSRCYSLENFPPVVDDFLGKLKTMRLAKCRYLKSIPPLKLNSLETLDLSSCHRLESFPLVVNGFLGKLKTLLVRKCYNLKSIPPLKLDSLEKLDLSFCCSLESFPCVVDGLLDKLKFLNIECCIMLRNIPRLRLTSLEHFNLSCCYSLERIPEILGDMRNIPGLLMHDTPIKEIPFPFKTLTQPQTLCDCGYVYLPNRMSTLAKFTIKNEEKVNAMQSSHVKYICVRHGGYRLEEYLSKSLTLFANVKELHLTSNHFTIIPKSIEHCKFLWKLILDDCTKLQEIKGIPPCLRMLSALNCKSLTLSCKSKLLNQELHEAGKTWFRLPQATFPEWFDHHCMAGISVSFWFRNKFPAIALCFVSSLTLDDSQRPVRVIINGNTFFYTHGWKTVERPRPTYGWMTGRSRPDSYHLHLFHMQMENFNDNMDKALLENKWNHAHVDFGFEFQKSGIHVLKEKSSMKDIRFTNPENDANIVIPRDEVTDLPHAMPPPEPINLSTELSSTSDETELLMNNLHFSPSFRRNFSRNNAANETEQIQCLSSFKSIFLDNQESEAHERESSHHCLIM